MGIDIPGQMRLINSRELHNDRTAPPTLQRTTGALAPRGTVELSAMWPRAGVAGGVAGDRSGRGHVAGDRACVGPATTEAGADID